MLIAERHTRLKELIARRGMCDLKSLSAELAVSHSTVRRDLEVLEQQGLVKLTHGGVIWVAEKSAGGGNGAGGGGGTARPYAFDQRMGYQLDAKRQIARAARDLVQPGETILIDGGTTTFFLAEELLGRPLQLVTNSLPIANLFLNDENVELILTGGLMYPRYGVLLGPSAENMLANIHTKTLFLSVAGINGGMLYNQNLLLVQSERRMMEQAQQVVLLADSTKFGQQALAQLGKLDEVDVVVTDANLSNEHREQVRSCGCELIVAG
jgi:DeoR family transcriptional regulator, fructose operon transcriptional repressor